MRKVIKKCLLTLLFAASLLTPVQAEGEDFQAFFTWIGMRETSEISSTVYPYEGSTFACASAWKQETVYLKAAVTALADTHISVSADSFIGEGITQVKRQTGGNRKTKVNQFAMHQCFSFRHIDKSERKFVA